MASCNWVLCSWIKQERNVQYFEKTQQDGKVKQAFFFDPDGMSQSTLSFIQKKSSNPQHNKQVFCCRVILLHSSNFSVKTQLNPISTPDLSLPVGVIHLLRICHLLNAVAVLCTICNVSNRSREPKNVSMVILFCVIARGWWEMVKMVDSCSLDKFQLMVWCVMWMGID
jgi:hypothetical protein